MSKVKCKLCERSFIDKKHLILHIEKAHWSQIPKEWSSSQYENYLRTGKTHGTCVICKCETPWNPSTGKYCRMCSKESCRKKARESAEKNLMKQKGVTHSQMLSDPDFQRKMVYSKKNSGEYKFNDNNTTVSIMYDSSYGKDFLEMLEHFMNFCSEDIMGPSPHTYIYIYEGKQHFYIPDFYIPSLNLEIEIKDGGNNPNKHPKIQAVDKVKESLKDEAMKKERVNYVKISNKDYTTFFKTLYILKERNSEPSNTKEFVCVTESITQTLEHASMINSEVSTVMWFYKRANEIKTDGDLISLMSQIEATINQMKRAMNDECISFDTKKNLESSIMDLQSLKEDLSYRMKLIK